MLIRIYNELINILSFTRNLRKLRSKINFSIDVPEIIEEIPDSHPRGFIKEFKKRRTTIVETYLKITKSLDSTDYKERIHALQLLADHILYSRSLKMPLNAARVQLALMKQVIVKRNSKREQLELMKDFSESSFGHPRSIRKFLKKLDIIEVPETGEELSKLDMGWDYHVHDNASYGRKSSAQLIIDAFIKGISELTVAYNNLEREDAVKEVLDAGKILGIKVNIAIEFSAMTNGRQFHFMYILPEFSSKKKRFKRFLKERSDYFDAFIHELEENQKKRDQNIIYLIDRFNKEHLPEINKGYKPGTVYYLKPLSNILRDKHAEKKIRSRRLLGEYLYPRLKSVLEKRLLLLEAHNNLAETKPEQFARDEINNIKKRYSDLQREYKTIEPEKLRSRYFADNELIIAESAVSRLKEISELAAKAGGTIKFIQPLEHGLEAAINMILDNLHHVYATEIYNIYDSIETEDKDFINYSRFLRYLNDRDIEKLKSLLDDLNIKVKDAKLKKLVAHPPKTKIAPYIGSDATGRSTLVPGMGFVFSERLAKHQKKLFLKTHHILPAEVSDLMEGNISDGKNRIICLGKIKNREKKIPGNGEKEKAIGPLRAIEYINPSLKNLILILTGFIPAYFTVGIEYAILWFVITGSRNIFVDMISGNGFKPSEWSAKDINWSNLANSLFWTGFSVPILGFVKSQFDIIWQWDHSGSTYEFAKFFFINTANGMYLASHNYLRGFDKGTIRGNFFRSILAWPLSALFAPLGNALMLPSIVQAKFWSDFVASIIEGSGKYKNLIRQKEKVITSILPDLEEDDKESEILAVLDIVYLINENTRVKTVIKKQLLPPIPFRERLKYYIRFRKPHPKTSRYFHILNEWLSDRKKYDQICNYIIKNYNNEKSVYLLQMLSSGYRKSSNWINKISG